MISCAIPYAPERVFATSRTEHVRNWTVVLLLPNMSTMGNCPHTSMSGIGNPSVTIRIFLVTSYATVAAVGQNCNTHELSMLEMRICSNAVGMTWRKDPYDVTNIASVFLLTQRTVPPSPCTMRTSLGVSSSMWNRPNCKRVMPSRYFTKYFDLALKLRNRATDLIFREHAYLIHETQLSRLCYFRHAIDIYKLATKLHVIQ